MWVTVIIILVFIGTVKFLRNAKYGDLKGPSPLLSMPLIGHAFLLGSDPAKRLLEMKHKYGDMFRCDLGNDVTVVLASAELTLKAFKQDVFNGRTFNELETLNAIQPIGSQGQRVLGVVSSEGQKWHEQRKFMIKNLSDLGVGKTETMEAIMDQEAEQLVKRLAQKSGAEVTGKGLCHTASNNVIWRFITDKRTKQDDPQLIALTEMIMDNFKDFDPGNPISALQINFYPFVKLLSWLGLPNQVDNAKKLTDVLWKQILESEPNAQGNYIERGLQEIEDNTVSGEKVCFSQADGRYHIRAQLQDLFVAGTDTSATLTEWCLLYLLRFPEQQDKIFKEISHVTNGNQRNITLADKVKCHYINAFIDEVARHCEFASLPPPHKTLNDVTFEGCFIPKGTQIAFFPYGINNDPVKFPEPNAFRPERFLDQAGAYHKNDNMVLFGLGKRRCPGEILGHSEIFVFLSSIVQSLEIKTVEGQNLWQPSQAGLVFYPAPFSFIPSKRTL